MAVGYRKGYPPPHYGMGLGRGNGPSPEILLILGSLIAYFCCILGAILSVTLLNLAGQRATSGVLGAIPPP